MAHTGSQGTVIDTSFVARAGIELKRAERYRVFVSIVVLDLRGLQTKYNGGYTAAVRRFVELVRTHTRACDFVANLEEGTVGLLFPETSRQGAEVAGRRIAELIRKQIELETGSPAVDLIPLEMVSYPDAAGTRTIGEFLMELAARNLN